MALSLPQPRWRRTSPRTSRLTPTTFRLGLAESPDAILHISLYKLHQMQASAARGHGPRLLRNLLLSGVLNRAITQVSRAAPPAEVLPTTAPSSEEFSGQAGMDSVADKQQQSSDVPMQQEVMVSTSAASEPLASSPSWNTTGLSAQCQRSDCPGSNSSNASCVCPLGPQPQAQDERCTNVNACCASSEQDVSQRVATLTSTMGECKAEETGEDGVSRGTVPEVSKATSEESQEIDETHGKRRRTSADSGVGLDSMSLLALEDGQSSLGDVFENSGEEEEERSANRHLGLPANSVVSDRMNSAAVDNVTSHSHAIGDGGSGRKSTVNNADAISCPATPNTSGSGRRSRKRSREDSALDEEDSEAGADNEDSPTSKRTRSETDGGWNY